MEPQHFFAPFVDLACCRGPEDVVEEDVRHVIVGTTHFRIGNCEGVWVGSCSCPGHGEGAEVGYAESFCDVDPGHGGRTFDQQVCVLTCRPGRRKKLFDKHTELRNVSWNTNGSQ